MNIGNNELVVKFCNLFDKIYIITLVDREDRLNKIIEMLMDMGVYGRLMEENRLEVVYAVKMPFLTESIVNSVNTNFNGRIGLFNCTYEHYRILSKMLAKGYKKILILEDDARFIKNLEVLINAFENGPKDFSLLHLDGFFFPATAESMSKWKSTLSDNIYEGKWVECSDLNLWASGAIAWSPEGAKSFIEKQKSKFEAVDLTTILMKNSYFFTVPLAIQENKNNMESDITNCASDYDSNNVYISKINRKDYYQYV